MINLEVLTPKGKEFEGRIDCLIMPTRAGEISVLPNHAPLVSVLKPGRLKMKTRDKEMIKEVEGGIFQIVKNQATLLLKKF